MEQPGGGFIARVPTFPEIEAHGEMRAEIRVRIQEQVQALVSALKSQDEPNPVDQPMMVEVRSVWI